MAVASVLCGPPVAAHAAELKLIAAGAVRGVIGGMIDDYSRATGHAFRVTIGSTGRLREIIAAGEPADLVITSAPLMRELEASGRITPGSKADIGRVGLGVVIRAGAPVPDIATPEALRQALVAAKSIAYTDPKLGGTSYLHLMKIAHGFGIADEVARKGVHASGGNNAVVKVAAGEAEIAVVLVTEIHDKRARLAGLLPPALQLWTVYSAAVPASSSEPALAREFIAALTAPAMRERWKAAGWSPAE
jgi:molybdate transport system substrate-binding protein